MVMKFDNERERAWEINVYNVLEICLRILVEL